MMYMYQKVMYGYQDPKLRYCNYRPSVITFNRGCVQIPNITPLATVACKKRHQILDSVGLKTDSTGNMVPQGNTLHENLDVDYVIMYRVADTGKSPDSRARLFITGRLHS